MADVMRSGGLGWFWPDQPGLRPPRVQLLPPGVHHPGIRVINQTNKSLFEKIVLAND